MMSHSYKRILFIFRATVIKYCKVFSTKMKTRTNMIVLEKFLYTKLQRLLNSFQDQFQILPLIFVYGHSLQLTQNFLKFSLKKVFCLTFQAENIWELFMYLIINLDIFWIFYFCERNFVSPIKYGFYGVFPSYFTSPLVII